MGNRVKKYRMKSIPAKFSEKGGFSAQFVSDGYSVDARTEILPAVISANGVQVGEGTAWDLVTSFLKSCVQRTANTGETVNVGSLLSFGLAIKGWYANKDSKDSKENVHVSTTLLGDLKPTVAFSMSNAVDGATLMLVTIMSEGCELGRIRQGAAFRINGKELRMLDGDTVTASLRTADGETVTAVCPITGSEADHIDATLPAAFSDAAFAGRTVRITVRGRCGDPEAGAQEKSIEATLEAGDTPTGPAPKITGAGTRGDDPGERLASGGESPTRTSRTPPDVILTLVHSTRLLPRVVKIMSVPAKCLSCHSPPTTRRQLKKRNNRLKGAVILGLRLVMLKKSGPRGPSTPENDGAIILHRRRMRTGPLLSTSARWALGVAVVPTRTF